MSAIIKEKNIIKFPVGENKTYSYDMNAGINLRVEGRGFAEYSFYGQAFDYRKSQLF